MRHFESATVEDVVLERYKVPFFTPSSVKTNLRSLPAMDNISSRTASSSHAFLKDDSRDHYFYSASFSSPMVALCD